MESEYRNVRGRCIERSATLIKKAQTFSRTHCATYSKRELVASVFSAGRPPQAELLPISERSPYEHTRLAITQRPPRFGAWSNDRTAESATCRRDRSWSAGEASPLEC